MSNRGLVRRAVVLGSMLSGRSSATPPSDQTKRPAHKILSFIDLKLAF